MLDPVNELMGDVPWFIAGDPDRIPVDGLPWLAQFVGVRTTVGASAAVQRAEIRQTAGWRRGTVASISSAVAATLTGTKTVVIREQYITAYGLRVETYIDETPDPAVTEAAILTHKPAGILLSYEAVAGTNWDTVNGANWDTQAGQVWDNKAGA